jgi:hypothetical protein
VVSLAREARSKQPSYDPPPRGIIDQVPIILEADVTKAEAARLQAQPCPKGKDDNPERRFVLIPKSNTYAPNEEEEKSRRKDRKTPKVEAPRREEKKETLNKPPIARRRSRQDLPALETKVPRDIPPQFRRSASAFAALPKDHGTPRTSAGDSFLSPDVSRGKDYFGSVPAPRHESTPNRPSSRSDTPLAGKRNSGNFENPRSRRNSNKKLTRPQQLSEEHGPRRTERHQSTHSDRHSAGRSSRGSNNSNRHYYSSS